MDPSVVVSFDEAIFNANNYVYPWNMLSNWTRINFILFDKIVNIKRNL